MSLKFTDYNKIYSLELERYLKSLSVDQLEKLLLSRYGRNFSVDEVLNMLACEYRVFVAFENETIIGIADLSVTKEKIYYELGYMIFPNFQNRGYGYKLVKHVFEVLTKEGYPNKIKAEAEVTNIASQKLLEKISTMYTPIKVEINAKYTPNTRIYYWIL